MPEPMSEEGTDWKRESIREILMWKREAVKCAGQLTEANKQNAELTRQLEEARKAICAVIDFIRQIFGPKYDKEIRDAVDAARSAPLTGETDGK